MEKRQTGFQETDAPVLFVFGRLNAHGNGARLPESEKLRSRLRMYSGCTADTDQLSALFLFCDIFLTMGFFLFVTVYFFLTHDKYFLHSLFAGMVPDFKE